MSLRLAEVICGASSRELVQAALEKHEVLNEWHETLDDERCRFRLLLEAHEAESFLDELDEQLGAADLDFRATLLSVEATLPRIEEKAPNGKQRKKKDRVSREEMYQDLREGTKASFAYLAYVVLSVIVAAIGLVRNDVAVLIGAMVIAPLLTPNMSLALGTTLGDGPFVWKALKVNAIGVSLALVLSLAIGLLVEVNPKLPSLESRSQVSLQDVALALAAGSAGALAMTSGASASLIGVMVAVALVPPLVAVGLLAAGGHWQMAMGALELVSVNVICVNLSGVVTFLAQGVSPRTWWEAERAKRAVRRALAAWIALLAVLVGLIVYSGQ